MSFLARLTNILLGYFFSYSIMYSSIIFVHAIQEVFMAEEWVKDAYNEARVEANLRAETNKTLGAAKQKNQELIAKLTVKDKERRSVEAGLKNA